MKSVMVHNFSQVPKADIPRSSFDRSHGVKTTFNAGDLVPILVDEVLPGDTFKVDMTGFARMATPIHPMMDNMFMDTHFFAVPMRLVWDNWKKFNGEQVNPGDSVDYVVPTMTSPTGTGYSNESLSDYFGIPTGVGDLEHSTLFHRAYNLIWNDWFRDQNLQDSVVVDKDDGPDSPADYVILKRGKRHDYFTSSLPWPQKGDSIDLPLGSTAPIIAPDDGANAMIVRKASDGSTPGFAGGLEHANGVNTTLGGGGGDAPVYFDPNGSLSADLSSATAATINELRQAFQVQKLLERDARSGTRYIEIIKSHFGVSSPDMRIQRPEYLGGGSSPVSITPIAQTSSTDGTSPQGNLGAFATASLHNHGFTKSFTEHCIVIGVVSVRADLTYQQGLNRMFSRGTRYDYYWPALANIGEQAVLNKEIYADGSPADDDVFGYQERFAEYRYKPSMITGKLRSNDPQSLDVWHLSQDFGSLPTLNSDFIEENPPIDRVVAVPSEPDFIFDSYIRMKCVRPMPMYSVPGLIDHF
jgi:hypothetical protein